MTEYAYPCRNTLIKKGKSQRAYERIIQFLQHGPGKATPISELTALTGMSSREIEDQITNARNAGTMIYWSNGYYLQDTPRD